MKKWKSWGERIGMRVLFVGVSAAAGSVLLAQMVMDGMKRRERKRGRTTK